ncbi:acetyltransferase [Collimonas arenae]|uniref:Acetyltransferase n=1 Tax=Collimonas arenae TaxID=279058 RepID=A0A0A1FBE3_9BURK|nr:acetyltransferase [Collimonas arenae]
MTRQVETYRTLSEHAGSQVVVVAGGVAAITEPAFGRKLNHVTGLGMGMPVLAGDLQDIERRYAALGLETQIDICPHTHGSTLAILAERGYAANAFSNTYVRYLTPADTDTASAGIEVCSDKALVGATFVADSVAGFSVQTVNRPRILLEALAQIALRRSDTLLFPAALDGQVAGTAGMSLIETPAGLLAHLYIASTLPAYRGRGIQLALLRARLTAARNAGCTLASVTARPANTSARNTERAGFSLAYTKVTFIKPLSNQS